MPRPSRLALLAAAVVVAAACTSGGTGSAPDEPLPPPAFTVSGVEVQSVAEPAPPLPDTVRAEVLATLDEYLLRAMVSPLRSGEPVGDLGSLFTGAAAARLAGPARAAMVDEGLPQASDVRGLVSTVGLGALAGADNDVVVVTATIDVRLEATGDDPLTIVRTGDLVLVPDGDAWKIDGYDMSTTRDSGAGPTTTAARK